MWGDKNFALPRSFPANVDFWSSFSVRKWTHAKTTTRHSNLQTVSVALIDLHVKFFMRRGVKSSQRSGRGEESLYIRGLLFLDQQILDGGFGSLAQRALSIYNI